MRIENETQNLHNFQNTTNNQNEEKEKIYVKKELLEQAQKLSQTEGGHGIIFGNRSISVSEQNLNDLKNLYKKDLIEYEGIFVAKGDAKDYLDQISNLVLNDLNVKNADKDNNGIISNAESLDVKNIIDPQLNSLLSPRDVLEQDEIARLEQDDSKFMSINDIIDIHIQLDKNKDGSISYKEVGIETYKENEKENGFEATVSGTGAAPEIEDKLKELFEKLAEIQEKIAELTSKLQGASEEKKMLLNEQINTLNSQAVMILAQIMTLLKSNQI